MKVELRNDDGLRFLLMEWPEKPGIEDLFRLAERLNEVTEHLEALEGSPDDIAEYAETGEMPDNPNAGQCMWSSGRLTLRPGWMSEDTHDRAESEGWMVFWDHDRQREVVQRVDELNRVGSRDGLLTDAAAIDRAQRAGLQVDSVTGQCFGYTK